MKHVANKQEITLSVYLEANMISELESFLAAFLKVIKELINKSRKTS